MPTPGISMEPNVLIVDDDVALCRMLKGYLGKEGWNVRAEHRASSGLASALADPPALIILDVMLPDFDGFEMLRRLRAEMDVYVLLLTARGEEVDRVVGLELGADDYLAKPFSLRELVARMRSILRRGPRTTDSPRDNNFTAGDFTVSVSSREVLWRSRGLDLTDLEFNLLTRLLARPSEVLSREELAEQTFSRPFHPLDRSLDMLVLRVRRKLAKLDGFTGEIKTIRSSGYMLLLKGIKG